MWEHFQSRMWNFVRDRTEGRQPAKQSHGTETDVLKPVGLLTAIPTCSAHSNTKPNKVLLTCGLPLHKPQVISDLIWEGLLYREQAGSNTPPSWEKMASLPQSMIFPWELWDYFLSLKRKHQGLVKKSNCYLICQSNQVTQGLCHYNSDLAITQARWPKINSNYGGFDLPSPWTVLTI